MLILNIEKNVNIEKQRISASQFKSQQLELLLKWSDLNLKYYSIPLKFQLKPVITSFTGLLLLITITSNTFSSSCVSCASIYLENLTTDFIIVTIARLHQSFCRN